MRCACVWCAWLTYASRLRSSVGILEEALDLTVDLCMALFLHGSGALRSYPHHSPLTLVAVY